MLYARRDRDAAGLATASPRCELQRAELEFGKTADRESKKTPAPAETTEEQRTHASNEGYETLPPPKNDAQPEG